MWKFTTFAEKKYVDKEVEEINAAKLFVLRAKAVKLSRKWLP